MNKERKFSALFSKGIAVICSIAMIFTMVTQISVTSFADDENLTVKTLADYSLYVPQGVTAPSAAKKVTVIDEDFFNSESRYYLGEEWYVVSGDSITLTDGLVLDNNVNLILLDGCSLTIQDNGTDAGIRLGVFNLTIWAGAEGQGSEVKGNGRLYAAGGAEGAGIGGDLHASYNGKITINGGIITAKGGYAGAGIGGGDMLNGNNITINGGTVTANGGSKAAGIGGGYRACGSSISINGSTVTAQGGTGAAGIGGGAASVDGDICSGSNITIMNSEVTALGGDGSVGIGSGLAGSDSSNIIVDTALHTLAGSRADIFREIKNDGNDLAEAIKYDSYVKITANYTPSYGVELQDYLHGNVTADKYSATEGETVTLTVTADEGYILDNLTVKDSSGKAISVTDSTFIMPADVVTVYASFAQSTSLYTIDVPEGVTTPTGSEKITVLDNSFSSSGYQSSLAGGWYAVSGDNINLKSIKLNGDVNLVLLDGCSMTVKTDDNNAGIYTNGHKFTIWAGAFGSNVAVEGTGKLSVTGGYGCSGIGGNDYTGNRRNIGDNITINGGVITATGGNEGAGIGGADRGAGCKIVINGGNVTANGGSGGAGIGGGQQSYGSDITINGGTVTANGGNEGAGIGGGGFGSGGVNTSGSKITINGGTVTANGGRGGAGIGGGETSDGTEIVINGGTVTANGGYNGAGIGGGSNGSGKRITVNNGYVTANGGYEAAGIGSGWGSMLDKCSGQYITINGGYVTAIGGDSGAGIGGGSDGSCSNVVFNGGVTTTKGYHSIGSGRAWNSGSSNVYVADSLGVKIGNDPKTSNDVAHTVSDDLSAKFSGGTYAKIGEFFTVTINESINGHVTSNYVNGCENDPIVLTITPDRGYKLTSLTVTDGSGNIIPVDNNTFTMPQGNVTIDSTFAAFVEDYTLIVPEGVTAPESSENITVIDNNYFDSDEKYTLAEGWYVVFYNSNELTKGITLDGDVNLIMLDGCSLTVKAPTNCAGIQTNGHKLTLWAGAYGKNVSVQNTGKLTVAGGQYAAGIGGIRNASGGNITVNGGKITATGGYGAAGIGGGYKGSGNNISVNGGLVIAQGGKNASGLGSGFGGSSSAIYAASTLTTQAGSSSDKVEVINNEGGDLASLLSGKTYTKIGFAYTVSASDCKDGRVSTSLARAVEGDVVTVTTAANVGYKEESITVLDNNGNSISVTGNTFVMPAGNVTVSAAFAQLTLDEYSILVPDGASYPDGAQGKAVTIIDNDYFSSDSEYVLSGGWYVVTGDEINLKKGITLTGDVNLILLDRCSLTIKAEANHAGIQTNNYKLTIWSGAAGKDAAVDGSGKLYAVGGENGAGIGGAGSTSANNGIRVTVNGGVIIAVGGMNGAGIGCGLKQFSFDIEINGGEVIAKGNAASALGGSSENAYQDNLISAAEMLTIMAGSNETTAEAIENDGGDLSEQLSLKQYVQITGETYSADYFETIAFNTQPEDAVVKIYKTAEFSIDVSYLGEGSITYQWYYSSDGGNTWKKAIDKGYATNTLVVTATAAKNGYMYSCLVIDSDGDMAASDIAKLTVSYSKVPIYFQDMIRNMMASPYYRWPSCVGYPSPYWGPGQVQPWKKSFKKK